MKKRNMAMVASTIGLSVLAVAGCGIQSQVSVSSNTTTNKAHGNVIVSNTARQTSNSISGNKQHNPNRPNNGKSSKTSSHTNSSTTINGFPKQIRNALQSIQKHTIKIPLFAPTKVSLPLQYALSHLGVATTVSSNSYSIDFMVINTPMAVNSSSLPTQNPKRRIGEFVVTKYNSSKGASTAVWKTAQADGGFGIPPNAKEVNLGLGITAKKGSRKNYTSILWNEGNWKIDVSSPNNDTIVQEDSKKIVGFLHNNMLPPPDRGFIYASGDSVIVLWSKANIGFEITNHFSTTSGLQEAVSTKKY